jgi:Na+/H+-dicarboxylate symporter
MAIIPTTVVSRFAEGEILQVLFVAILFGMRWRWSASPPPRC